MPMTTDELKKLVEEATPGDWYVYGRDGCGHLLFIGGPNNRQLPIAQIEPIPRKYQGAEGQFDNARLIAAAPALAREVIALREAAKEVVETHMLTGGGSPEAWAKHRAALAALRAVLGESE
jgi:hypothetical protein